MKHAGKQPERLWLRGCMQAARESWLRGCIQAARESESSTPMHAAASNPVAGVDVAPPVRPPAALAPRQQYLHVPTRTGSAHSACQPAILAMRPLSSGGSRIASITHARQCRQTGTHACLHVGRQACLHACRQAGRQAGRHACPALDLSWCRPRCPPNHRTMVTQLIEKERIRTTLPKAKALRRVADRTIGLGKELETQGACATWDCACKGPRLHATACAWDRTACDRGCMGPRRMRPRVHGTAPHATACAWDRAAWDRAAWDHGCMGPRRMGPRMHGAVLRGTASAIFFAEAA
eukprot:264142-Chlamydomonas_euryale.AAC.2